MTALAEFRAALTDPAHPLPAGLTDGAGRPAGRRFDVYRNNVAVGLAEALETGFPAIRSLVGETFFRAMAALHLRQHPPRLPLMAVYGQDLPAFLETFAPVAHLPYLADVARLELALRESYHAADALALDPARLAGLSPDGLADTVLHPAPALRLVRSRWPIRQIRAKALGLGPAPRLDPAAPVQAVLVTRPGFDPRLHDLTPAQTLLFGRLAEGQALGPALSGIAGGDTVLTTLLGLLLNEAAITDLTGVPA